MEGTVTEETVAEGRLVEGSTNEKKTVVEGTVNPHMHKIILQLYCIKRVPRDPLNDMLNQLDKMNFLSHKSN